MPATSTESFGHSFADPGLLARALTHRSAGSPHNERLEFLGDALLNLFVSEVLFQRWPRADEGALTRARAELVRESTLARIARRLDLGPRLKLGPGEMKSGGHRRDSILADALEARLDDFAHAEARDGGKPHALARDAEIPRAVSNLRFFAHAATQFSSESHHGEAGLNYTLRQPLGVVGTISPWNLPLYLFTWKIAPALAAGNTVVLKPSEVTPATAAMFAELANDAGLPAGVLNVVNGGGVEAGEAIVQHEAVRAVSFTGSTAVGRRIAGIAGPLLKKVSLELGGKNPTLVFADSDWRDHLDLIARSTFQNSGQICLCGSRILVERRVYAEFRDAFVQAALALRPGDPMDRDANLGPLVSQAHFDKVVAAIARARDEGSRVLCGGVALDRPGWFVAPTVIEGLGPDCASNQEEIFGPVLAVVRVASFEEALQLVNDHEYGNGTSIFTRDGDTARQFEERVNVGMVGVNVPIPVPMAFHCFGGWKRSVFGP